MDNLHQNSPKPKTMMATLSGPIVLENPQLLEGSLCMLEFNGQMWLSPSSILTRKFQYFKSTNMTFDSIGHYFA